MILAATKARLAAGLELDAADRRLIVAALDKLDVRQAERLARVAGMRERDRLIRLLAADHYRALPSTRARAAAISTAAKRYAATGWVRDRHKVSCPDHLRTRPEGYLWRAFKAYPVFPFSVRALQEILK